MQRFSPLLALTTILSSALVLQAQEAKDSPEQLLQKCAWIAGSWSGEALGGQFEETWNRPSGPSMMGMFKLVREGKVSFYELLTIVPKEDSLVLRLKHFDGALKGWEEKDESQEFPFVSADRKEIRFKGLVFKRISRNEMQIVVQTKSGDETQELVFNCKRAQRGAKKPSERDGKDGEDGGEGEDGEDGADGQDAKPGSR
ncbi:MAG: DUF6265 family protein [Planctomycetota bacterium]